MRNHSEREPKQQFTTRRKTTIDTGHDIESGSDLDTGELETGRDRTGSHRRTVAQVGEFGVIDRSLRGRVQSEHTILGPGDDAAVVAAPDGRVVATTDMLVEGRHFRLDWSDPLDVGRKAVAQNGADVAAMGARCTGFLVGLGCPSDTPVAVTDALSEGLWREAQRAGASIIGGDLVRTDSVVISITALGDLQGRAPVLRSGAQRGDVVAVVGKLGWSAAGLALLEAGRTEASALVDAHRVPTPDYEQGIVAARAGATSMTDVSDGLIADLGHIAQASSAVLQLDSDSFPIGNDIYSAAADLGVPALTWVLGGGEDHAFAATFPSPDDVPAEWTVVGRVAESGGDATVTVDGAPFAGSAGWSSFQT